MQTLDGIDDGIVKKVEATVGYSAVELTFSQNLFGNFPDQRQHRFSEGNLLM